MCIFNTAIKEVGGTKILVAITKDSRQLVVYRNYVSGGVPAKNEAKKKPKEPTPAMILPFPCPVGGGDVEFVDLSGNKTLFQDLSDCFPKLVSTRKWKEAREGGNSRSFKLEVKKVGSYNVSVAKNIDDLRRIDESVFVVDQNVDLLLSKHYATDFGFVIACFRDDEEKHPLAYVHALAAGKTLFVPTRHHHHGKEEEKVAEWDHEIFSVGAASEAGESISERELRLKKTLDETKFALSQPKKYASDVLAQLPVQLEKGHLRLLEKTGMLENTDTIFPLQ
jgi:hypothetical protein